MQVIFVYICSNAKKDYAAEYRLTAPNAKLADAGKMRCEEDRNQTPPEMLEIHEQSFPP
jgi:hypothetical protein